jgi:hypothetical protein
MRRTLALVTLVGMIGIGSGCNHTAGKCDCEVGPVATWIPPHPVPATGIIAPASGTAPAPEPIKSMPKESPKL